RIRNGSGDRALHVGDLAEPPVAVVVAKDDADHRLDQPSGRRPRALNLDAVVAAHGGLAALFPSSAVAVLLIISAHDPRAANNHGRGHRRRDYPRCSSHMPSFDTPVNPLAVALAVAQAESD